MKTVKQMIIEHIAATNPDKMSSKYDTVKDMILAHFLNADDVHVVNVRTDAHDNDALRVCERYRLGGQRVTKFMTFDKPGNIH